MPSHLIALVPLLPLLAAFWIGMAYLCGSNRQEEGERDTANIAQFAAALSLLLLLAIDLQAMLYGAPGQIVSGAWFSSGRVRLDISFTLDTLGLAMATLVAFIAFLTLRFSVNYMHREAGFQRFFLLLSLFTGAMLLIVTAGSAALMFVGWELAGVSSYLLIAYAFERPTATDNATRAFVTNRIGDAGFILALYLCFSLFGTTEWPQVLGAQDPQESLVPALLAGCLLLAALAKSAQVPFAPWVARALEGPTPSSAIFYGALMVHAGIYLLLRLQPLLEQIALLMPLLVLLGLLSVVYGYFSGLVQSDVKSSLMFSTTTQVGLMLISCGLGWFELAAWHLAAHALWRAYQFLSAPSIMQLASRPARPVPAWLLRNRRLYNASLQRFWLDNLANNLLTRSTQSFAREADDFDTRIVNRLVGLPTSTNAISSLAEWEARQRGGMLREGDIGTGEGMAGKLMEWLAQILQWFEDRLILHGGGKGLLALLHRLGQRIQLIEQLLEHPRYLWLMIMATFVVII